MKRISMKKMGCLRAVSGVFMAAILACSTMRVEASGFSILEQSTTGLGRSLAGMTSDVDEPSALFFNPSLAAWHDRMAFTAGGNWLHVNAYSDRSHTSEAEGRDGGNGGGWSHVPNFDFIYPFADDFAFGLVFSATSGTATKWNRYWMGRYESIDCELAVVEATPSFSWKPTDNLSIGAGLIIQYADFYMKNSVPLSAGGHSFQDGKLELEGDSIALGYSIGLTYKPFEHTYIGLSYRSKMTQELELEGKLKTGEDFSTLTGYPRRFKGDADCDMELPAVVNFGITQEINEKFSVMADVSWTKASDFDKMTVEFDTGDDLGKFIKTATGSSSSTEVMKWKDTWRFALGCEYKLNQKWTLRAGTAYDRCPISSCYHRAASLPDLDRIWLSCGVSYQWNENLRFDLGYVHIFFEDDKMKFDMPDGKKAVMNVDSDTDIFSYAVTYKF